MSYILKTISELFKEIEKQDLKKIVHVYGWEELTLKFTILSKALYKLNASPTNILQDFR